MGNIMEQFLQFFVDNKTYIQIYGMWVIVILVYILYLLRQRRKSKEREELLKKLYEQYSYDDESEEECECSSKDQYFETQYVPIKKKWGIDDIFDIIVLLCIPVVGWVILIAVVIRLRYKPIKERRVYQVCNKCGRSKRVI